jgi:signal transduction histidine kinase
MVIILAALLPVLGYLQYRWLGEVSEREREQMQASLQRSLAAVRDDLDRQIAQVYVSFQFGPSTDGADAGDRLAKAMKDWRRSTVRPNLVGDLFWRRKVGNGLPVLKHWNENTQAWDATDWSKEFGPDPFDDGPIFKLAVNEARMTLSAGLFGSENPTLFIPLGASAPLLPPDLRPVGPPGVEKPFVIGLSTVRASERELDEAIIRLNLEFLKSRLLKQIVRDHFGDSLADYKVEVQDRKLHTIYASEQQVASARQDQETPDAQEQLLQVRFEDPVPVANTEIVVTEPWLREDDPDAAVANSVNPANANSFLARTRGAFSGALVTLAPVPEGVGNSRFFHYRMSPKDGQPDVLTFTAGIALRSGLWTMRATHRAGSLDAAVEQGRRRNLIVAFGILTMLAASVAIAMISSNREKRLARQQIEFVSAVSHEMRTPLAVICSAGENLADGLVRDPERMRGYGKLIRDEGRRLTETVEQALGFASLESGLKRYALAPSKVRPIVESALAALDASIQEGKFLIDVTLPDDLPLVAADVPAIARALQNLIGNAMKYGGEDRSIRIRAAHEGAASRVRIAVEDHGPGIAAADLPHIFKPFYRGRDAIAAQVQGSGLGLSLVEDIVQAHGGSVDVQTGPEGSTFSILLPITGAEELA